MQFTIFFTILGFLFGASLGSFLKVLADRSLKKTTFGGRSECNFCHHKLAWYDLLPVFSFISLLGKCRYCHKNIGSEYIFVEVISGLTLSYLFYRYSFLFPPQTDPYQYFVYFYDLFFKSFIMVVLGSIIITDIKKMLIPDRIILPSIVIALIALVVISIVKVAYFYYYLTLTPVGRYLLPPHTDYFYRHSYDMIWPLLGGLMMAF